jgi:hypothetical protein
MDYTWRKPEKESQPEPEGLKAQINQLQRQVTAQAESIKTLELLCEAMTRRLATATDATTEQLRIAEHRDSELRKTEKRLDDALRMLKENGCLVPKVSRTQLQRKTYQREYMRTYRKRKHDASKIAEVTVSDRDAENRIL